MRVLVTGATGFVGRWAVDGLIARQADVVAVARRPVSCPGLGGMVAADLLAPGEVRRVLASVRPDIILHLAWTVEHGRFWTAPENLDWTAATLNMLRVAGEIGVKHFVGVGTCFEYQWPANSDCDEFLTAAVPTMLYATAKDAVRRLAEESGGVPFTWARLFYLFGPDENENRLVASLASRLARGQAAPLSSGGALRDFLHVKDAGAALAAIALSDVRGRINVGSGQAVAVKEIAERLGRISGRPELVRVGELPDRPDEPPRIVADIRRLRRATGFQPVFDLDSGLENTYTWHQARL